jgi:tetratricopeptide (TPR) repeat protein
VALAGEAAAFGLRPEDRSGLRAFALSEVARLRIEKGAYDAAVEAIDLALLEQLGAGDQDLARILKANRVAALRLAALEHAKAGAYPAARAYLERIQALADLAPEARAQLEQDGLRIIHLAGNRHIDALDYPAAAAVYREGVRRYPKDDTSRHNLLAVLERLAGALVREARCGDAGPYLEEIAILEPTADFPAKARTNCLVERARQRLDAADPGEAVALLTEARRLAPEEPAVRRALAVALARWVEALVKAARCDEAQVQAKGLLALRDPRVKPPEVQAMLRGCGR